MGQTENIQSRVVNKAVQGQELYIGKGSKPTNTSSQGLFDFNNRVSIRSGALLQSPPCSGAHK